MQADFVHLRVHTEFSLVDSIVRVDELMQAVSKSGMSAVAVTDFCNLFAAVKCYKAALKHGVKPLIGADFVCVMDKNKPDSTAQLTLLCQNDRGYRHLTRLVSRAYIEGQYQGKPRIYAEWLESCHEGLILLSGGRLGNVGQALLQQDKARAIEAARRWQAWFGDRLYLEIQRTGREDEAVYNAGIIDIATALDLPLVATNEVCFLSPDLFEAHEARVCIHDGNTLADPQRPKRYSREQYLRSTEEMQALFSDLPQALENTVEISKRCTVTLSLGKNVLPQFPVPAHSTEEKYLSELASAGLAERLDRIESLNQKIVTEDFRRRYTERLKVELDVINSMGFAGYFLIVADFVQWAREHDVPVGPGRGSGAGSLVAYALKITDLDPLEFDLLFERFLNPERVSMPDFDIDFCMEGRDRVIEYVAQRYGRENVSQIITFGTMAAKAVIRDVGRVLGHPYGFVDKLAKLIPFELGMTLERALSQEAELKARYEEEEEVAELFNLALALEGITRNAGKHAGGVVIAPSALTDFTAVFCEEGSEQWVSQFDKDDVEAVGLVKFDFLGLRTLTIIHQTLKTIHQQNPSAPPIEINHIPMDDEATFALIRACQTTAVFQVESRGMKDLIHRLQPDCFEDLIALVALFRPGPLQSGMVDDFIDRKHGRARVELLHPEIEPLLRPTYGVILYQEQVMQIAQVLANYTLGGADLLRRAMGKKKPEEMAKQREIFVQSAARRGVEEETAAMIFDLMEKFAGYGFNKPHAAAYALLSYQTAWLKAHYPAAFMAAVLSSDMDNTEKVVLLLEECRRLGLEVIPPSIQTAELQFTVRDEKTIIYGLGAIKGLGESAIHSILEARKLLKPEDGLFEFCQYVDLRRVNRRVLEVLVKSGALDDFKIERAVMCAALDAAIEQGGEYHHQKTHHQTSLFDHWDDLAKMEYPKVRPWTEQERLQAEKATLGFYLSGHPVDVYQQEFKSMVTPLAHLSSPQVSKKTMICGMITSLRRVMTKRGKAMVILSLEDKTSRVDVVVFSEVYEANSVAFEPHHPVVVHCEISNDNYTGGVKLTALEVFSIAHARAHFAKCVKVVLTPESPVLEIQRLLSEHPGACGVELWYRNALAQTRLSLKKSYNVLPEDRLLEHLGSAQGTTVEVCYKKEG